MNCERCELHLSALIDNELTEELRMKVRQHLQDCDVCRVELEDLRFVDARLGGLRLPDHKTAVARPIPQQGDQSEHTDPSRPGDQSIHGRWFHGHFFPWSIMVAIAACLAFAVVFMPDPNSKLGPQAPIALAGRLVRTTGSVEIMVPGSDQWQRIDGANEIRFQNGVHVRTCPSVACEIETTEKATLRMDETAELILHEPSRIEVLKGQVWCRASDSNSLQVDTNSPDWANSILTTMVCPSDSEFQWNVGKQEATCQSLAGQQTQWGSAYVRCEVAPGERVAIDAQHNIKRSKQDSPTAKLWQLPLLAVGETLDQELTEILESLLVQIGSTKAGYLHESEIRQLGPAGAIPLLAYVQSARSHKQIAVRRNAMRIAAEMADQTAVARLQQLCSDDDASIAELAQRAVDKLE